MHASLTIHSKYKKTQAFKPIVKQATGDQLDLLRILVIGFFVFFLAIGSLSSTTMISENVIAVPQQGSITSQNGNIFSVTLSDSYRIVEGTIDGYRGFAYVVDDDDMIFFTDPVQDVTMQMSIPAGDAYGSFLFGADIDKDDNTEYMFRNRNTTLDYEFVIVDFDASTVRSYEPPINYPDVVGVGDFNDDGEIDILLESTIHYDMATFDLTTNSTIGTWTTPSNERFMDRIVGRFWDAQKDYIAVQVQDPSTTRARNISLIDGNGTLLTQVDHWYMRDIEKINHGGIAEDLVVLDYFGNATVYHGEDLGISFNTTIHPGIAGSGFNVEVGNLTLDEYEDFIAVEGQDGIAYCVNGENGSVIHTTTGIENTGSVYFDVGFIDSDEISDAVIEHYTERAGLLRGTDGEISYVENLIEKPTRYIVYEMNGDHRDDILLQTSGELNQVHVIVSDVDSPILSPEPINPLHPTVLDDFIEFEVSIDEASPVDISELYYREVGESFWNQPHDGLFGSANGKTFFAFIVGLDGGEYEYYFEFRDAYLNIGTYGNSTHPQIFTVAGNLAWEVEPVITGIDSSSSQYKLAKGNQSDGSRVIYVAKIVDSDYLRLLTYSEYGVLLNQTDVSFIQGYDFAILSGNFDGDNTTDPIILLSDKMTDYHAYVYHGRNLTLYHDSVIPGFTKTFSQQRVADVDGDNLDELILVGVTASPSYFLAIMDDDGSWDSTVLLDDDGEYQPDAIAVGKISALSGYQIIMERLDDKLEIYNSTDLSLIRTLTLSLGSSYTDVDLRDIKVFDNASQSLQQFLVEYTLWNGSQSYSAFAFIDSDTTALDVSNMYIIPDRNHQWGHLHDVDNDATDELFIKSTSGEISLIQFDPFFSIEWNTTITNSNPLASIIIDFTGDGFEELAVFTDEDESLTTISFQGVVSRELFVGEVHGAFPIGNIDAGEGYEIAAYPIIKDGTSTVGAFRDLDWYYRLNVTTSYSPSEILQLEQLYVNVSATNIYNEVVEDASVYMSLNHTLDNETIIDTFGFYYEPSMQKYMTAVDANWPIGIANMTISIEHDFYTPWWKSTTNALTTRSNLSVEVFVEEIVDQGGSQTVEVWVRDSLGGSINDASVSVEINGSLYSTSYSDPFFKYEDAIVDLPSGIYEVVATANHPYAIQSANNTVDFVVQTITDDLIITNDFPTTIIQFDEVTAWFNITDAYGYSITDANAMLRLGPKEFPLIEMDAGCYRLSEPMNLETGNHTFDLFLEKNDISNPFAMQVNFEVYGNLTPIVNYESTIEGGSYIDVSVFVRDEIGPVNIGTNVTVEVNGVNFTATQNPDNLAEFSAHVYANLSAGENYFFVYADADYALNGWKGRFDISIQSIATAHVTSSLDWVFTQGDQTEISVIVSDWIGEDVTSSQVTLFIRGTSYSLSLSESGAYSVSVSTSGWAPDEYPWSLFVSDAYVTLEDEKNGTITLMGILDITISIETETPTQNAPLIVEISIQDTYGNPVPDLEISATLMGQSASEITESDEVGKYAARWDSAPSTEGYGNKSIIVEVNGAFLETEDQETKYFHLFSAAPEISMDIPSIGTTAGFVFLVSFIGMFLYFKMSSSMSIKDRSKDDLEKSIKRMDLLYTLIVVVCGAGIGGSYLLATLGEYFAALALAVALLGISILLYGLWLYRDAVSSVLVREVLSRKRMVLGLWHLFFVPIVIIMIVTYGSQIN